MLLAAGEIGEREGEFPVWLFAAEDLSFDITVLPADVVLERIRDLERELGVPAEVLDAVSRIARLSSCVLPVGASMFRSSISPAFLIFERSAPNTSSPASIRWSPTSMGSSV